MSKRLRHPTGIVYGNRVWSAVAGYELVAKYYDDWYWQLFWKSNEWPLIVEEIGRFCSCASPALDLGTGTGLYLDEMLRLGIEAVGVDASEAMLKEASNNLPDSARLICATAEELPFPDGMFNLVTACRVLSHVGDLNIALQELGRVTKTDGRLIVSDVSAYHNYTTVRIPTPDGDVHIETHKYTLDQFVAVAENSGYWTVDYIKSVSYKDLLWKPKASEYPALDVSSTKPIFFFGVLKRC